MPIQILNYFINQYFNPRKLSAMDPNYKFSEEEMQQLVQVLFHQYQRIVQVKPSQESKPLQLLIEIIQKKEDEIANKVKQSTALIQNFVSDELHEIKSHNARSKYDDDKSHRLQAWENIIQQKTNAIMQKLVIQQKYQTLISKYSAKEIQLRNINSQLNRYKYQNQQKQKEITKLKQKIQQLQKQNQQNQQAIKEKDKINQSLQKNNATLETLCNNLKNNLDQFEDSMKKYKQYIEQQIKTEISKKIQQTLAKDIRVKQQQIDKYKMWISILQEDIAYYSKFSSKSNPVDDKWIQQYTRYRELRAERKGRTLINKLKVMNGVHIKNDQQFIKNIRRSLNLPNPVNK